ncbi:MAG TPA: NAD-dependent succinate-semialdehyde dehydrogenase [Saprospiraceae bacterium]|nr:NAD-dependent succinate-semialdehyde dehydrogenase [Saprospiraceae bacterium]
MSSFISHNPYTLDTYREYKALSREEILQKLEQSANSYRIWSGMPLETRIQHLEQVPEVLKARKKDLAAAMVREMGKPYKQAVAEVEKCAWLCEYFLDQGPQLLKKEIVKTEYSESYIQYDPIGAVLGIMPWNFPFWQVFRFAFPALVAGNVALLKHAPNVPECALLIEQLFLDASGMDHLFINLFAEVEDIPDIIDHRSVAGVAVTGSYRAGSAVAEQAGKNIKPTTLELGGSDAFIICASADLEKAAKDAVDARMKNSGQTCIAAKRIIVVEEVYEKVKPLLLDRFSQLQTGDPMDEKTDLGPQARKDLLDKYQKQVQSTLDYGAKQILTMEVPEQGYFAQPVFLEDIPDNAPAAREEIFGPCLSLFKARDAEHAVQIANDSRYALGTAIYSGDLGEAKQMATQLHSGAITINKIVSSDPRLPFGGNKDSGYGRELGREGLLHFTNKKSIVIS